MGVFKNEVGRPSNKTLKTRRILYCITAIFLIAIIGSVVYLLNSNTNKLKGEVDTKDSEVLIKINNNQNVREVGSGAVNEYVFSSVNDKFELTIVNKKNYTLYYEIYIYNPKSGNKLYKSGSILKNKSFTNTLNMSIFKDSMTQTSSNQLSIKWFKNSKSEKNYVNESSIRFHYSKPLIYVYDYLDFSGYTFDESINEKKRHQKIYIDKSSDVEQFSYLFNVSDKPYYYRTFIYNGSKINSLKLSKVGSCNILNSQSQSLAQQQYTFDEKQKSNVLQIKFYNTQKDCTKDKKGIRNTNVVYTFKDSFINEINKFIVEKYSKDLYAIKGPLNANNWIVQVYYKKSFSLDKWKKISEEKYYNNTIYNVKFNKQESKNETYRVFVKWTKDNSDETYTDVSIDKWKADGWLKIKKDNTTWMYKDFIIKW